MDTASAQPPSRFLVEILVILLRVSLGVYFVYSGGLKIFVVGFDDFVDAVGNYQIVGAPWDAVAGYLLPWVELCAGLALVLGWAFRGAALLVVAMLVVFNVALALAWSSGLEINCGCYAKSAEPTNYPLKILSNAAWLLCGVLILIEPSFRKFALAILAKLGFERTRCPKP